MAPSLNRRRELKEDVVMNCESRTFLGKGAIFVHFDRTKDQCVAVLGQEALWKSCERRPKFGANGETLSSVNIQA